MTSAPDGSWPMTLLTTLGAPTSLTNIEALTLWAQSESTPETWHNPLATTMDGFTGVAKNDAGVKAYPDEAKGVAATLATLELPAYAAVVRAFTSNAGLAAVYQAVNASPWCPGCQEGHYPVALWQAAQQHPAPVHPPAPAPSPPVPPQEATVQLPTIVPRNQPYPSPWPPDPVVERVQVLLDRYGSTQIAVDGRAGIATGDAIAAFEAAHGITVGNPAGQRILGPKGWAALLGVS